MKYNKRYLLLMSIFCMLAVVVFYAGTCGQDDPTESAFDCIDEDRQLDCEESDECCDLSICEGKGGCLEIFFCDDGLDNDRDGAIDCEDFDDECCLDDFCENHPACIESGNCADGLDNDFDDLIDCNDTEECCDTPECENDPACTGQGTTFTINLTLINNSNINVNFFEINEPFANTLLRPFQSRIVLIFDIIIGDILTFDVLNPRGGSLVVEEDCQVMPEVPFGPDPFSGGTGNVIFDGTTITCEGDLVTPSFSGSP